MSNQDVEAACLTAAILTIINAGLIVVLILVVYHLYLESKAQTVQEIVKVENARVRQRFIRTPIHVPKHDCPLCQSGGMERGDVNTGQENGARGAVMVERDNAANQMLELRNRLDYMRPVASALGRQSGRENGSESTAAQQENGAWGAVMVERDNAANQMLGLRNRLDYINMRPLASALGRQSVADDIPGEILDDEGGRFATVKRRVKSHSENGSESTAAQENGAWGAVMVERDNAANQMLGLRNRLDYINMRPLASALGRQSVADDIPGEILDDEGGRFATVKRRVKSHSENGNECTAAQENGARGTIRERRMERIKEANETMELINKMDQGNNDNVNMGPVPSVLGGQSVEIDVTQEILDNGGGRSGTIHVSPKPFL